MVGDGWGRRDDSPKSPFAPSHPVPALNSFLRWLPPTCRVMSGARSALVMRSRRRLTPFPACAVPSKNPCGPTAPPSIVDTHVELVRDGSGRETGDTEDAGGLGEERRRGHLVDDLGGLLVRRRLCGLALRRRGIPPPIISSTCRCVLKPSLQTSPLSSPSSLSSPASCAVPRPSPTHLLILSSDTQTARRY